MPRPIRFCLVSTFYPPTTFGGDGVQVQRVARLLAGAGHAVTVVHAVDAYRALGGKERPNGHADDSIELVQIDAHSGAAEPLLTYLGGRPLLSRPQLEKALSGPFDVIHFHNPSLIGGPGVLGMGRASLRLYTAHEQWLVCPTHVLWKNKREICEKPTCWRCSLRHGRPPQLWRSSHLLERSLTNLDALIVPSRTSAVLHERFADLVRIEHIPHFVPKPEPPAEPPARRPYFLYAGRLEQVKGIEDLVHAFRDRSEELLIAGRGPLEPELRRAAAGAPHIRFLGWQDARSLSALYRSALAVVAPTRAHESFGLVPVEALAHGTPVVVRDFGALGELVEQSGAGIGYRSPAELQQALDRLAGDTALRTELGRRGRSVYLERWTPEAHLSRYLGLISDLAGLRGEGDLERAAQASAA